MAKNVIIVGSGKHGKVVADLVLSIGDHLIGFLDDVTPEGESLGFPILGSHSKYVDYINDAYFIVAIGSASGREKVVNDMPGARWYTAIHPSAVVSPFNKGIGEGTVIMAQAVVNTGAQIGKHCIINTAAVVEHDNRISDYVHISVGAKLAGTVSVGKSTWVGVGVTVIDEISICSECMIGGGAVITKDISEKGTYVGIPVRKIK